MQRDAFNGAWPVAFDERRSAFYLAASDHGLCVLITCRRGDRAGSAGQKPASGPSSRPRPGRVDERLISPEEAKDIGAQGEHANDPLGVSKCQSPSSSATFSQHRTAVTCTKKLLDPLFRTITRRRDGPRNGHGLYIGSPRPESELANYQAAHGIPLPRLCI